MKNVKFFLVGLILAFSSTVSATGIPTVDIVGNIRGKLQLTQDSLNAIETRVQSVQQVQQITNEISMIQNQITQSLREIRNLENLGSFDLVRATLAMNRLNGAADRAGSLSFATASLADSYDNYQDADHYTTNRDDLDREVFSTARDRWNNNALNTAKASAAVLQVENTTVNDDAARLEGLNDDIENVDGAVQAQQAGNQVHSLNAAQLLSVRTLLMNQQQMQIQEAAAKAERDAMQKVSWEKMTENPMVDTPGDAF